MMGRKGDKEGWQHPTYKMVASLKREWRTLNRNPLIRLKAIDKARQRTVEDTPFGVPVTTRD